ncbi:MAG: hypothetical protein ABSB35_30165 [Bryobacteraceae bacterium]
MLSFAFASPAGINWKAVWLDRNPVVLKPGETHQYKVMGLNGADRTADLTHSPYLTIVSSDPKILTIDQGRAVFKGVAPGETEIRVSFSEATSLVRVHVGNDQQTP